MNFDESLAGLGDWANFYFWLNFSNIWADFFLGNIYFFWAKNRKLIIFGHIFTIGQHWFFKSVHLATNTLYLMLEIFLKNHPKKYLHSHRIRPLPWRLIVTHSLESTFWNYNVCFIGWMIFQSFLVFWINLLS